MVEITAASLDDRTALNAKLVEIAVYLIGIISSPTEPVSQLYRELDADRIQDTGYAPTKARPKCLHNRLPTCPTRPLQTQGDNARPLEQANRCSSIRSRCTPPPRRPPIPRTPSTSGAPVSLNVHQPRGDMGRTRCCWGGVRLRPGPMEPGKLPSSSDVTSMTSHSVTKAPQRQMLYLTPNAYSQHNLSLKHIANDSLS